MIEIIPAIIPYKFEDIEEKMSRVEGLVARVQIDIVDGEFAEGETWPFVNAAWQEIRGLPFINEMRVQVDMMVSGPDDYIGSLVEIGVEEFIIHYSSTDNPDKCIEIVRAFEKNVGLAFKPSEDIGVADDLIKVCDFVQFMGSDNIGHAGEELDERIYDKIREFRDKYPDIPLQVDIGVNPDSAPQLVAAGATALVSGSAVYNNDDIEEAIRRLTNNG